VSGWRKAHIHGRKAFGEALNELGVVSPELGKRLKEQERVCVEGYSPQWRNPKHGAEEGRPRARQRGEMATSILRSAGMSETAIEAALSGEEPVPVATKPGRGATTHFPRYAKACVAEMEAQRAVREWTPEMTARWGEPVITELNVACNENDKLRMVVPAVYVNEFSGYVKFGMHDVQSATDMFERPGDRATVRDVEAGYLQSLLNEAMWRFAGCRDPRDRNRTMHFVHNHFGFQWSALAFWEDESVFIDGCGALGVQWRQWVDDSIRRHPDLRTAVIRETMISRLQKCCGFHMANNKGNLLAALSVTYFGLQLEIEKRMTFVPAQKLEKMARLAAEQRDSTVLHPRAVARVAGKLVAAGAGLHAPKALTRLLFLILKSAEGWDRALWNAPAYAALMDLIAVTIGDMNGRNWDPRPLALEVHVDASEWGIGMWFHDLTGSKRTWECVCAYPPEIAAETRQLTFHSTAREAFGYYVVHLFIARIADLAALAHGKCVRIVNDNQSAVSSAEKTTARDPLLFLYCLRQSVEAETHGYTTRMEWCRRTEGGLPHADALSKPLEAGDIHMVRTFVMETVLPYFGVERLCVDLMATRENTQCVTYWSRYHELEAAQTDLLASWPVLDMPAGGVAWLYAPFYLLKEVCRIVRLKQIDCLLVHPSFTSRASRAQGIGALVHALPAVKRGTFPFVEKRADGEAILARGPNCPDNVDIAPRSGKIAISHIDWR
jgi:hypothetical protein